MGIYAIAAAYDFAAAQLAPPEWSLPRIIDVVPGWSWQAWTIVGLAIVLLVVFESAYRLDRMNRKLIPSHTDTIISSFAQLVREAEGLRIIWANERDPDIDTLCTEAIEWSIRAIKAIAGKVGHMQDLQIRSLAELPLQGDITEQDFDVPLAHERHGDRISLIRKRHYDVKYWLRDFIQTLQPGSATVDAQSRGV